MILERLKSEFDGFELHDKWYKAGAMAFLLYFVVSCFLLLFFGQYSVKEAANLFVYVLYFIFTIAVVIEYWKKVISYYSKVWFKFLLAALSFIVYKYSELHADDFINEFTLNEPSYFPVASVLLTAMFLIYSWLLFVSIILLIPPVSGLLSPQLIY